MTTALRAVSCPIGRRAHLHPRIPPPCRHSAPCRSSGQQGDAGPDPATSPDELIAQLLASDPAAKEQVGRVSAAAARVAELQMEQARLGRALAEAEAASKLNAAQREQAARASAQRHMAEAEVRAAGLLLRAAELEAEGVEAQRAVLEEQAARDEDRLESGKAAAVAATGGLVGSLPLVLATAGSPLGGLVALGGVAASSLLFGVVYRYALRTDAADLQLKGGVVAAFGLVRGIGQASEIMNAASGNWTQLPQVEALASAAAAMGESMLIFGFASAALEIALQRGWVKALGSSRRGG